MRLVRIFIGLVVILALAVFLGNNREEAVRLWLAPGVVLEELNLATTIVATFAIGILLGFVLGLVQIFGQQIQIRSLKRRNERLHTELNSLRHSALDENIFDGTQVPESISEVLPATDISTESTEIKAQ